MCTIVPVALSTAENVESVVSSRSALDVVVVLAEGIACPPPPEHAAKIAAAESSARSRACTKMSLHTRVLDSGNVKEALGNRYGFLMLGAL
jgi:hypothetical protein